jgi:hypothetical protein
MLETERGRAPGVGAQRGSAADAVARLVSVPGEGRPPMRPALLLDEAALLRGSPESGWRRHQRGLEEKVAAEGVAGDGGDLGIGGKIDR